MEPVLCCLWCAELCFVRSAEEGPLFQATEAREREKEMGRLKAELAAAEHASQQVCLTCTSWHTSRNPV